MSQSQIFKSCHALPAPSYTGLIGVILIGLASAWRLCYFEQSCRLFPPDTICAFIQSMTGRVTDRQKRVWVEWPSSDLVLSMVSDPPNDLPQRFPVTPWILKGLPQPFAIDTITWCPFWYETETAPFSAPSVKSRSVEIENRIKLDRWRYPLLDPLRQQHANAKSSSIQCKHIPKYVVECKTDVIFRSCW